MNISIADLVELSKLFIPVIAIAGVYIAWQQFTANKEKLRLDLYDKRYKVYDELITPIHRAISTEEGLSSKEIGRFLSACSEAEFLTPDKVYKQVEEARLLLLSHHTASDRLRKLIEEGAKASEIERVKEQSCRIDGELDEFHPKLTNAFKTILGFQKF